MTACCAGCNCMDCGIEDAESVGMLVPREHWLMIHPEDGGILCANCMVKRAKKLPRAINITGLITFAEDYDVEPSVYQIVKQVGQSFAFKREKS